MKPLSFMLIAGEPSGDRLAAELVQALRQSAVARVLPGRDDLQPLHAALAPRFFGAGGPQMAAAGVELAFDMTAHAVVGVVDVLRNYGKFRRLFNELLQLALERQPDAIVCVDFAGFNSRFMRALRQRVSARRGSFNNWRPRLIQFVSPQVWGSRGNRARQLERDLDLLLSIFPFEKEWYALRTPRLRVEFVGHPIVDRYPRAEHNAPSVESPGAAPNPLVLLLPGSRVGELQRHLPVVVEAWQRIRAVRPSAQARMILPREELVQLARGRGLPPEVEVQVGGLDVALPRADLALASTGTVTVECAWFGVPTVAFYQTSWGNYQLAKRLIRVAFLAMPNLLAGEMVYPEFLQHAATPENLAREALDLLDNTERRAWMRRKLSRIKQSLGGPGACRRAAEHVLSLV